MSVSSGIARHTTAAATTVDAASAATHTRKVWRASSQRVSASAANAKKTNTSKFPSAAGHGVVAVNVKSARPIHGSGRFPARERAPRSQVNRDHGDRVQGPHRRWPSRAEQETGQPDDVPRIVCPAVANLQRVSVGAPPDQGNHGGGNDDDRRADEVLPAGLPRRHEHDRRDRDPAGADNEEHAGHDGRAQPPAAGHGPRRERDERPVHRYLSGRCKPAKRLVDRENAQQGYPGSGGHHEAVGPKRRRAQRARDGHEQQAGKGNEAEVGLKHTARARMNRNLVHPPARGDEHEKRSENDEPGLNESRRRSLG